MGPRGPSSASRVEGRVLVTRQKLCGSKTRPEHPALADLGAVAFWTLMLSSTRRPAFLFWFQLGGLRA